jgi:hypothetical protein
MTPEETKPRIHAYMIVHYGISYIPVVLKSIIDPVDQVHILYTPHPSHGHQTTAQCPETREEIWAASEIGSNKIKRYELKNIFHEGPQRDHAVEVCRQAGADMILVVDCDEVWPSEVLSKALEYAWTENKARAWLVNMLHFWRSFSWVCRDEGWPVRIIDLRHPMGTVGYIPREFGPILHFGYAVPDAIAVYKWKIHGHKYELRPDWFETKWNVWPPPPDCHPTNSEGFWNPEPFDKEKLPLLLHDHPFFRLERID